MKKLHLRQFGCIVFSLIIIVLMANGALAKKQPSFNIKIEKQIYPSPLHLGEEMEIIYTVTSPYNLDDARFALFTLKGVGLISLESIGFTAREETNEKYLREGVIKKWLWFKIGAKEERKFRLRVRINEKYEVKNTNTIPIVNISVGVRSWTVEHRTGLGSYTIRLFLIDKEKGILGSQKELIEKLPVEYIYDAESGTFYSPGELDVPVNVKWNREIIQKMIELEPALSDSEALLLHSDHYKIGIPEDVIYWDEEEKSWITNEKKMFEIFLNDGWFTALKEGKRNAWIENEKEKIKRQYEDEKKGGSSKAKFFRPSDSPWNSNISDFDRVTKPFYGWWKFKNHLYNRTQGLLASANKEPILNGKARLLITYHYNAQFYRELTIYDDTDNNGYFYLEHTIPSGATSCKAYSIIYPSGPNPTFPVVDLSDPNITQPSYWKDSNDSTLFIMRELGFATPHVFYANPIPVNLDTIWTDTFPAVSQPQSGCINIYQDMIHARTLTSPPPSDPLRILWEPGYVPVRDTDTVWTCYKNDTIWVSGCTLSAHLDTDEWDDDILYHEFGHYQMDFYNNGFDPWQDANYTKDHDWWLDDTVYQATAWIEGWANYVSGCSRAGTGTDTLLINNDLMIGDSLSDRYYYCNLENPWDHSDSSAHAFEGGEYCEGAVTGILFDIYDTYNEYPYPRDSTKSDSLARGFDSTFAIMKNFNPADPGTFTATHCWGLTHFYNAWRIWNYGDLSKLNQILNYHGYYTTVPPALDSIAAFQKARVIGVYNVWFDSTKKELSRAGIEKYCVYRLDPDTTEFKRVAEVNAIDTLYLDSDVDVGDSLKYFVTAVDSNWMESDPSDTISWVVTHWLLVSDTDEASAHGKKIEQDGSGDIYIVYTAFDSIYHVSTTDKGSSWSGKPIGEGEYPSIDLDSNDKSNVVWMWYSPPMHIAQSILYFARYTGSSWTDPDTLWDYPAGSGIPCFQIDDDDTGHVAWNSFPQFGPGFRGGSELDYGYFPTQTTSPAFNDTTIAEDPTDPGIEVPSLAIDSSFYHSHVVYTKDGNIYYIKINKTSWTTPQRISDSSNNSANPYIEYDKNSSKIHVVWQQDKGGNSQIMHISKALQSRWPRPVVACSTSYNSVNPVITGGKYVFWSEEIPNNSEIYYSRYNGISWGDPVLVKNTPEASMYPQVTHTSGAASDTVFVAWTDGDSLPYTIEFQQLNFVKTVLFSGHISENTTWSTDILIKGDVWVDLGVTLTIDAGVNVKFIPNFDNEHAGIDTTRAEFIIHGSLVLIGNDSLPTTFTSNSPHPEIGDWYGIRFIEPESKGIQERDFAKPTDDKRADIDFEPVEKEMEFLTGEASSLTKAEVRQDALPVVDNAADGDFVFTENEFIVEIRRERQRSDEKKERGEEGIFTI